MAKRFLNFLSARLGFGIFNIRGRYLQDGLFTLHSDHFRRDPAFRDAYARGVQASHGIDPCFEWRVHVALWCAQVALRADGDFVECGVNAGFISSATMRRLQWNALARRFYLIDTFCGPALDQYSKQEVKDGRSRIAEQALRVGGYVTDIDRVKANYAEWPKALVIQGKVPDVLRNIDFGPIAFLHLDMNCALPEEKAFQFFWERLSSGAIVLFDDYAYYGHASQRDAIDSAANAVGAAILSLPTGQGLILR